MTFAGYDVDNELRVRTNRLTRAAERAITRAALLHELALAKAKSADDEDEYRFWQGVTELAGELLEAVITIERADFGTALAWLPDHQLNQIEEWLQVREQDGAADAAAGRVGA